MASATGPTSRPNHRPVPQRRQFCRGLAALPFTALVPPDAWAQTRSSNPTMPNPRSPFVPRPALQRLVPFDRGPFPYAGRVDETRLPFFDLVEPATRRRGRTSASGTVYWEKETYSDRRSLLHIPAGFDPRRAALIVVYLHGHMATLERTVIGEHQIPRQIEESAVNAVLLAPQLAYDAPDSSPGKLWADGGFARYVDEAAERLLQLWGERRIGATLNAAPIIIVAFSGGYKSALWSLHRGGANHRVRGVILLDALYGEEDKLAAWFVRWRRQAFLLSLYTASTQSHQETLKGLLRAAKIAPSSGIPARLTSGTVSFLDGGGVQRHMAYPLDGPPRDPLRHLLPRIPGFARSAAP